MLRAAPASGNDPVENSWSTAQLLSLKKRKPFDILVEGLTVSSSRGDKIRTCDLLDPNQAL